MIGKLTDQTFLGQSSNLTRLIPSLEVANKSPVVFPSGPKWLTTQNWFPGCQNVTTSQFPPLLSHLNETAHVHFLKRRQHRLKHKESSTTGRKNYRSPGKEHFTGRGRHINATCSHSQNFRNSIYHTWGGS